MDAMEAIRTRRSIRKYKSQPVARELIEAVIDAGRLAATGGNRQPWEFIVVTDAARRAEISVMGGSGKFIAQAPACIAIFMGEGITPVEDCAAAAENMLLAAHALGLGTCWVANPRASFADRACKFFEAPEGKKFFGLIALGYPDEKPEKAKRTLAEVVHWEKF
jgi:nitroreductase